MISNNYLLIKKIQSDIYRLQQIDADTGELFGGWPDFKTLPEAIIAVNAFREKHKAEYRLEIEI